MPHPHATSRTLLPVMHPVEHNLRSTPVTSGNVARHLLVGSTSQAKIENLPAEESVLIDKQSKSDDFQEEALTLSSQSSLTAMLLGLRSWKYNEQKLHSSVSLMERAILHSPCAQFQLNEHTADGERGGDKGKREEGEGGKKVGMGEGERGEMEIYGIRKGQIFASLMK